MEHLWAEIRGKSTTWRNIQLNLERGYQGTKIKEYAKEEKRDWKKVRVINSTGELIGESTNYWKMTREKVIGEKDMGRKREKAVKVEGGEAGFWGEI